MARRNSPYISVQKKLKKISDAMNGAFKKETPKILPDGFRILTHGELIIVGDLRFKDGKWQEVPENLIGTPAPTGMLSQVIVRDLDVSPSQVPPRVEHSFGYSPQEMDYDFDDGL